MGRSPCCTKEDEMKRGAWTALEDKILTDYITSHGEGKWRRIPKQAGLKRCGKSCRLRWLNYLRPDIKRGNITADEEDLIIRLHRLLGNRWSLIAGRLPGRTDNEIKNYWNSYLSKRVRGELKNAKKPKLSIPGPEEEERHQMPLTPAAVSQPPLLPPPLPLSGHPIVNLGCTMDGDAINNLPVLEYESSNVTSSPSISRDELSSRLVSCISNVLEPEFSSFDEFGFGQFDSVMEGNWGSLEGVEGDISCFVPMDYDAQSYEQNQWIM